LQKLGVRALKIFIIDDDEVSNFIYKKVIEAVEVSESVREFPRAQTALNYLIENLDNPSALPDLVFLDINMPVMNGWQFLDEYSQKVSPAISKKIIICMLSSSVYKKDINRANKYTQVDEYISKPLTSEKIRFLVEKYFQSS